MDICGVAIVGGNGSGKTTIGKELANSLGYKHMDVEDYYFKPSVIPYTNSRTKDEVQKLLLSDIQKYRKFILSSVNCDYGEEINALYNYVIYIHVPLDIRIDRVKQRSFNKFGTRILEGGDMYDQEQKFFKFVASRTMDKTDLWLQSVTCPIIHIDGTNSVENNIKIIKDKIYKDVL